MKNTIEISNKLPFTLEEYENRLNEVRKVMAKQSIDILLVNDPVELNYLLGYRSFGFDALPWQCLIITPAGDPIVVTRKLESTSYTSQTCVKEIYCYDDRDDPMQVTINILKKKVKTTGKTVAIPSRTRYITPYHMDYLKKELNDVENIIDGGGIIASCRMVKSRREIQYIEEAAEITSNVMNNISNKLDPFPSEKEIASVVMHDLIQKGSEHPGLVPLMGIGKRSAFGHSTWENHRAKKQDVIFLEFSGCVYRYFAPIMRTLSIGEPSDKAKSFEEASRFAVNQVIKNTHPGMRIEHMAEICQGALKEYNVTQYSHVRTGYSVGIGFDIWLDGVSVMKGEKLTLKENMVFHIIPFLTDFEMSVAVSETIVIGRNGARKITNVPQEILVI